MASQARAEKSMPQLRILVCGRIGIGKSSLINFLLGYDVCKVGDPGESDFDLEAMTRDVEGHSVIMNDVEVIIYDSPGLQEGGVDEKKYLEMMYEKCHDIDLVFYCHDMTVARWTPTEVNAIRLLTQRFKAPFWSKAICVLTRGNCVQPAHPMTEEEKKEHFQNWTRNLARKFRAEVDKQLKALSTDVRASEQIKDSKYARNSAGGKLAEGGTDSSDTDMKGKQANDSAHSETDKHPDSERADGVLADSERAEGERADGEYVDGERPDGEHADSERLDGKRAEGRHVDGDNSSRSLEDAIAKDGTETSDNVNCEEPKAGDRGVCWQTEPAGSIPIVSEIQGRAESIPVVPTGSAAVQFLPTGKHFIADLWVTCMERITDPHLTEIFTQATDVGERMITQAEIERDGHLFGITYEGLKRLGSDVSEHLAPFRKYVVAKIQYQTTPATRSLTNSAQFELSLMAPPVNQQQVPHNHELALMQPTDNPLASEPVASRHRTQSDPNYLLIMDKELTERLKKEIERKYIIKWKWVAGGGMVGALVGSTFPGAGTLIGFGIGAGTGYLIAKLLIHIQQSKEHPAAMK